ncbi:MAG: L-threonylcarbamoyladenylate synthase [Fimbriimonadaceae bacterium]
MSILTPTPDAIREAARVIREGGVVVMPTETVYGLACHALNEKAVQRVYEIKGRPSDNPLIVHIADASWLPKVAREVSDLAKKLAAKYWPGPLTMVLPKQTSVPDLTTGGLDTVAVRVPSHPVARRLIEEAGVPVAAPSANLFMALSPTSAQAVDAEISLEVPIILDGGPCEVGLESTVIDLTDNPPRILRPGGVTRADLQAMVGMPLGHQPPSAIRNSPGQYERHYAPRAVVTIVDAMEANQAGLTFESASGPTQVRMPRDPKAYATALYGAMRRLDIMGVAEIFVVAPPDSEEWEAVWDRLKKASAKLL